MKRAVITGATGGIGGKTAEVLGLAGYEVIITGIDEPAAGGYVQPGK